MHVQIKSLISQILLYFISIVYSWIIRHKQFVSIVEEIHGKYGMINFKKFLQKVSWLFLVACKVKNNILKIWEDYRTELKVVNFKIVPKLAPKH